MKNNDPKLFEDDGLLLPEVGNWAITKHQKIKYYSSLFANSMKNKWKCRVYIDLFSCAGKCKIRESKKIIPGSPLLALSIDDPFDKYIFCEENPDHMEALKTRVKRYFPERDCSFVLGNTNSNSSLQAIFSAIPQFSINFTGLTFCFADPYRIGELNFDTLRNLAKRLIIDFLVLIPSYMDINRNEHNYTRANDESLDKFLGTTEWRSIWATNKRQYLRFGNFIVEQLCQQMKKLGYLFDTTDDLEIVRGAKNLPLYHLGFFSQNELGLRFWRETKKNTNEQLGLGF